MKYSIRACTRRFSASGAFDTLCPLCYTNCAFPVHRAVHYYTAIRISCYAKTHFTRQKTAVDELLAGREDLRRADSVREKVVADLLQLVVTERVVCGCG